MDFYRDDNSVGFNVIIIIGINLRWKTLKYLLLRYQYNFVFISFLSLSLQHAGSNDLSFEPSGI
jgi:hypothetical protein